MSNDQQPAVVVKNVSKSFKIPLDKSSDIKQHIVNIFKPKRGYREFQALKDVSFEIRKGDFFGIVGKNGSGKSTLLKTMAGIYSPDKGLVQVNGSLTPFIELGVGFNPELTGRENVFLNGALLGFSKKEMDSMYDEIVSFAELHDFMEERLKNYSSGMQVRLAFSIAVRAETDILVLDEVLAVGDEAFQKKCFSYFEQLKRKEKTVVLVTHDMTAVERFCNRAVFIENGKVKKMGNPYHVAAAYSRSNDEAYEVSHEVLPEQQESDISIIVTGIDGSEKNHFTHGDKMKVRLSWTRPGVKFAGVAIIRQSGEYVFGANTYQDKWRLKELNGLEYEVDLNLGDGDYFIKAGLFGQDDTDIIDFEENGSLFTVNRDYNDSRWGGLTKLHYKWR